jgi:hypothetical protein
MMKSFKQFILEYDFTQKKGLSGTEHVHTFEVPSEKGTSKVRVEIAHQHNNGTHYHDVSYSIDHSVNMGDRESLHPSVRKTVMHRVSGALEDYVRNNVLTKPGRHIVFGVAADNNPGDEKRKAETQALGFKRLGKKTGGGYSRRSIYNQLTYDVPVAESFISEEEYRGQHQAPGPDSGQPLHDTRGIYPDDFHGPNGFRYYADYGNDYDRHSYNQITRVKNDPDAHVWVHRAVPIDVHKQAMKSDAPLQQMIKKGDWVTPSKDYAKEHGEANLGGKFKIASIRVRARHLYTDGNSVHEFGYHPD